MFKVVDGDARNILCEAVEKHHASVLVVGSHDYGAINRFFEAVSGSGFKFQHVERNHPADSWKFNIHSRYLHENRLSWSIPAKLGNMTKLHYLELNGNMPIGNIPSELGKLIDLFDMNVASNHFEGPIPDNLSSCKI
ncbi:hypothetical protein OROMI_014505 [Orobanche minor]